MKAISNSPFRPQNFPVSDDETHLRILQTTDIHVNLLPYNYFTDTPDPGVGLSQLTGLIAAARKQADNTLLLETGDFLQGTPLGDLYAQRNPTGGPSHPAMIMMNALRYDAGTLGNHEFNYGLDFLTAVVSGAGFPIVLANATTRLGETPTEDETLFPPYAFLDRMVLDASGQSRLLRIGVIGFVPPQIAVWDRRHLENRLFMRGITEAARAYVPQMKAEGADLIIALSHSGIGHPQDIALQENASIPLAAIDGIDVILCGHQHRRFPSAHFTGIDGVDPDKGTLHGKPAVMAGFWGSDLGVIDLAITQNPDGEWNVRRHLSYLHPIPDQPQPPEDVSLNLEQEHSDTLSHIRTSVATLNCPLHSYFTFAGYDLATRAVAMAQLDYARQKLGPQELPLLSAASPFRAGGHAGPANFTELHPGPLTLRGIADLYQFPNTLSVLRVAGAQLRDWLERSAGKYLQIRANVADQLLLNGDFPSYYYDMILGVEYEIDLTQPARFGIDGQLAEPGANRIVNLRYAGRLVEDDQAFLIATNSYRAGGGGAFPGTGEGSDQVLTSPDEIRTILTEWVRNRRELDIEQVQNWRFAPISGASALLHSSPKARAHLPETPLPLEPTGTTDGGFELYRLVL